MGVPLGYPESARGGLVRRCPCLTQTRLTLTTPSDPRDETEATPEDEAPATEPTEDVTPAPEPEPEPAPPPEPDAGDEPEEPGVGEAIGGVKAAFKRMLDAHVTLLRAELEIAGKELGIIAGLAVGALVILLLVLGLLYVGGFLFFGEWLFGSMGWGIIHGTLLGAAFIGFVGINLAGGDVRAYGAGAVIGLAVTIILAALLISNVGNEGGEAVRDWIDSEFQTEQLPFGDEWLVLFIGFVIVGIIGAIVALIASWQTQAGHPFAMLVTGFIVGGFVGAIWFPTRYQAADGVMGLAIMVGLITWIVAGAILAARRGFDPEARYADLIPRESIAAFERTKDFLTEQWERQKDRMLGR